jgi:hypothetical protein
MLDSKLMKTIKHYILISLTLLFAVGCDEDFVKVNTNPYSVNKVDPALLLAGAQRSHIGTWAAEHTIVQQFVIPYNTGATVGFSLNEDIDANSNPKWDQSYPQIRNIVQAMSLLGPGTDRVNLMSMLRIWKAQIFMGLVDDYGDTPYFNAAQGLDRQNQFFYPAYDDDAAIYQDLYKELKEAIAALNPSADFVSADLFYGSNAHSSTKTADAAAQVAKWTKLGNSLLLRLGMHYSKLDPAKAQSIVAEAFAGGVMTSNADNAFVKYDGTLNVETDNNNLRNFSQYNYAAEPFVNQLKSTNDPRGKSILALFTDPGALSNEANPDTNLANQYGVPIGKSEVQLVKSPYRGTRGTGLNYSQMNVWKIASPAAPDFYVTYAQTSLLLAEAAQRGWVSGSAQTYYENGIRADMGVYPLYPGVVTIPETDILAYLADPAVAFNPTDAFKLINTQYWIVNVRNGTEAFANFRRSGYPALSPNLFNTKLNGGFVRRLSYPDVERSANSTNYKAALDAIGGDVLTTRVFWDVQ